MRKSTGAFILSVLAALTIPAISSAADKLNGATYSNGPAVAPSPADPMAGIDPKKIITTDSGLRFIDITEGTGAAPKKGQIVTVNYTGWLKDGTKFDSSYDRNQPFQFAIGQGQVIRGWDEGVAGMKVGGKRKLMIPPALGYGAAGAGDVIPPNSDLIFDVELLKTQDAQ